MRQANSYAEYSRMKLNALFNSLRLQIINAKKTNYATSPKTFIQWQTTAGGPGVLVKQLVINAKRRSEKNLLKVKGNTLSEYQLKEQQKRLNARNSI